MRAELLGPGPRRRGGFDLSAARALLTCEGDCGGDGDPDAVEATEHAFLERAPNGRKALDLIYICLACRAKRVWGCDVRDDEAEAA